MRQEHRIYTGSTNTCLRPVPNTSLGSTNQGFTIFTLQPLQPQVLLGSLATLHSLTHETPPYNL